MSSLALILYRVATPIFLKLGFQRIDVGVVGTGSMYPTFPKGSGKTDEENEAQVVARPSMRLFPAGISVFGTTYGAYSLQHGDIVSFQTEATDQHLQAIATKSGNLGLTGYIKRVIGLPGDVLELRNGFVYRNNELLLEPYVASPHSTYGGDTIPECKKILVPENQMVVMGDNRKASDDSRFSLGLIPLSGVEFVLPWSEQQETYGMNWRDPSKDADSVGKPEFDEQEFLRLLNSFRTENKRKNLKLQTKLQSTSELRARAILASNDLSFEATRSGITMRQAMDKVGYSNIVIGEAPVLGYYTADELMTYFRSQTRWKNFLLESEYQDVGVSSVVGNLNGCPTQIMVIHMAGYVPAEYDSAVVQSWADAQKSIQEALPSWIKSREFGDAYESKKTEYERMIQILQERENITTRILTKMRAKQWLTKQDEEDIIVSKKLSDEASELAKKLNSQ